MRRPLRSEKLLQALLILASLFIFIYYHVLQPETVIQLPVHTIKIANPASPGLAYATLLTPSDAQYLGELENDIYFRSIRLLNYQLQHSNNTRTTRGIPFLVLATSDVALWKRDKLEQEGATIIMVEKLGSDWLQPLTNRWKDIMAKLRLWELVQYDRILFLDADTFLLKSLDGVFDDPASNLRKSLENNDEIKPDEPALPVNYLLASHPEVLHTSHSYPPPEWPNFNGGFFLMSPSLQMCYYLTSLLSIPERFDSTYMEQSLLNYAHREMGNMPWSRLDWKWNINLPNMNDVQEGVHSVHAKLWSPGTDLQPTEIELMNLWSIAREEMETYYRERPARRKLSADYKP
ncbi:glycosyltransferase family 8 protein [Stipitochalara longipes BDJ]|nr:glycosyltransferase family 8 protein [Stipitochalara longipes BDJ]